MKKYILFFFAFIFLVFPFFSEVFAAGSTGDLTSKDFTIDVGDIYPGIKSEEDTQNIANWILGNIIQNMMLALGAISILVMTIGAGYMILHTGQENLLSKGKTIFMGGIYAMVVALSSYYLIAIVRYLLYSTTS